MVTFNGQIETADVSFDPGVCFGGGWGLVDLVLFGEMEVMHKQMCIHTQNLSLSLPIPHLSLFYLFI